MVLGTKVKVAAFSIAAGVLALLAILSLESFGNPIPILLGWMLVAVAVLGVPVALAVWARSAMAPWTYGATLWATNAVVVLWQDPEWFDLGSPAATLFVVAVQVVAFLLVPGAVGHATVVILRRRKSAVT